MSSMYTEQQVKDITVQRLVAGQLQNNVYYIRWGDNCIVVDPTYDVEIVNYCKVNNIKPTAIILTHGHFDHCGGAQLLMQHYGAMDVYCNVNDWDMASNASKNIWGLSCCDCVPNKNIIEGKLDIQGIVIDVIATPGHSKGGICIVVGDYLLTGDTLFAGTIGRTDLEGSDYDEIIHSLSKLKKLPNDYMVCPGHGDTSTLSKEKQYNSYMVLA